jgi:hypothetical protein
VVTITGTNFSTATAVAFGGAGAVWFDVKSATSIIAKSPSGGVVDVTVTAVGGISATSLADHFTYTGAATAGLYIDPETGTDTGDCPQTAPCATLNYALEEATAGDTITIEGGGSFGPIYLTQPITINGPADGTSSIVWSSAQPGCVGAIVGSCNGSANANYAVEIVATASSAVELNNLVIDNGAGTNGAMHRFRGECQHEGRRLARRQWERPATAADGLLTRLVDGFDIQQLRLRLQRRGRRHFPAFIVASLAQLQRRTLQPVLGLVRDNP